MGGIRVISTTTVHAPPHNVHHLHLTPWDLRLLRLARIQRGLLFPKPNPHDHVAFNAVQHLKDSLSSTLHFFPPLAGRLTFDENLQHNTCSVSILCNNAGALFVHAIAHHTTLSHIRDSPYVPSILYQFFQFNHSSNDQPTSTPLLAVQVTELVDGIFIACSVNHCVADGTSFWHFFNSWAQISRGLDAVLVLSNPPVLERWFPHDVHPPIPFPIYTKQKRDCDGLCPPQRVFHFTKEKIAQLKAKANAEVKHNTRTISSLQALFSHVWRSVIRNQRLDPEEDVSFCFTMGLRQRIMEPPLAANYFGNAIKADYLRMKAGEVVEGGIGKAALEMNKIIGLHTQEMLERYYRGWIKDPIIANPTNLTSTTLVVMSSPRFPIYANDFGWGPPVAVRCVAGELHSKYGKLLLFPGSEEGSIDLHLSVDDEILKAMERDSEFMHFVSLS